MVNRLLLWAQQTCSRRLEKLMKNKSTLIIAHRLSTIEHADQILVVEDGIVKEQGTHETLMQNELGIYKILYQKQFYMNEAILNSKIDKKEKA